MQAVINDWLASLKQRIRGARQRAVLAANAEQIRLYHEIGRDILNRQTQQGWGAKVIDHLSADLRAAFPDMKGLSASNLKYMRFFRAGVSGSLNWSAVCCPIAVVPHPRPNQQSI